MVYIWWMPCFPLSNPILATISTLPIQNRGTVLDPELLDCSVCIYFIISAIDCNKLDERCCICIWLHLPIVFFFLHFCEFYLVYLFLLYLTCNYIWYYLVLLVVAVVFVVVIRSKNTTITTTTTTTTTKTTNTNTTTTTTTTTCHYFIEYCSYYSSAYKILYFKCFFTIFIKNTNTLFTTPGSNSICSSLLIPNIQNHAHLLSFITENS